MTDFICNVCGSRNHVAELAGSAASSATWLRDPHTLQMKSVMQPYCGTERRAGDSFPSIAPARAPRRKARHGKQVSFSLRVSRLGEKLCFFSAGHPPLDLGQQFRLALNPHADL